MDWELRRLYGEVYAVEFPDGMQVPWKPLSYGDFLYYTNLLTEGRVPTSYVEDEIFRKCVVSPVVLELTDTLLAGRVSLVAQAILTASGPSAPEEFNALMETKRVEIQKPLEQLVMVVAQAFPTYTMEDIYSMSYDQFMMRLAQAEWLLMKSERLQEPISLYKETPQAPGKRPDPRSLKKDFDQRTRNKELEVASHMANSKRGDRKIPQEIPPKPTMEQMNAKRDKIEFSKDNMELTMAGGLTGHEMLDGVVTQAKVMKNMEKIYPHLFGKKKTEEAK